MVLSLLSSVQNQFGTMAAFRRSKSLILTTVCAAM
jgi:hypothetical protein